MPQSRKRRRDEGRNEIKMCGGYSMRYKETLKNEQERWICSRHTLGEDADGEMRYCQGSARRFPWEAELEPHTYHSKWCKPVPDDEEMRQFKDELHRNAAADDTAHDDTCRARPTGKRMTRRTSGCDALCPFWLRCLTQVGGINWWLAVAVSAFLVAGVGEIDCYGERDSITSTTVDS